MSSYQFVNSLTSCYGQRGDGSVPSADYYNPQAYNGCYGAANVAAAQAGPGPASPVTASYPGPGYLQQNGADHHSHHASHHGLNSTAYSAAAAAVCSGQNNRLSHHQTPTSIPTRTPTPSSCKYGVVEAAASPQDLSTSSTGAGQSSDGSRASPNQPQSGRGASSSSTTANPSANSESNNNSSSKGSSGQPQIYPWMRKVHVGQNKFGKSKLFNSFIFPCLPLSCPPRVLSCCGMFCLVVNVSKRYSPSLSFACKQNDVVSWFLSFLW